MIIRIVVRKNKVRTPIAHGKGEHVVWDNCDQVILGKPQVTDRDGFKELHKAGELVHVGPANKKGVVHCMLKDVSECEADEHFHYAVVSWIDRKTGVFHELRFDTLGWLMNDEGKTLETIHTDPDKRKQKV